jgi:uncharacterized 2Fe-2S/4Fe-4S cluster protein (DUF4445 family)
MDKCTIRFSPDNKTIQVFKGQTILAAAISAGVYINSSCGGDGVCGRCKVIVKSGPVQYQPSGRISPQEKKCGWCLACLSTVQGDVEVEVPPESRLDVGKVTDEQAKFLRLKGIYSQAEDIDKGISVIPQDLFSHSPLATKLYLEIPPPSFDDRVSDLERLYREIRRYYDIPIMQTGLTNIKRLGHLLRSSDWKITVTLGKRNGTTEIVIIEPGDTSKRNYGVAFDIGTTTVSGQLVDLNTKRILSTKATHNQQTMFGSDVITRIIFAQEEDGLERLHHAIIDSMNEIIREMIRDSGVNLNDVTAVICAGNTTMVHLLLRVEPTFIRRQPYVPTANFVPVIRAAEVGIKVNPRGLLACVPGVSTYVGGDITAGVIASGLDKQDKLTLLIDVGTNGEIVLGNREWLVSASASAGPAFEGSGTSCGMRATRGAIQRVQIREDFSLEYSTIGNSRPRGICGSGFIDCLAELLKREVILKDGQFNKELNCPRLRKGEYGWEFLLVSKEDSEAGSDIVITEVDIENLKRSKGAIYAACSTLVSRMGLEFSQIEQFYIAGGFGNYLDIEKAVTIGLLPDLPRERFRFIGNSSLVGAREILLSHQAYTLAQEVAKSITYFELSTEPKYMDEYVAALFFPHTDLDRFRSLKLTRPRRE